MDEKLRKWAALVVLLVALLASSAAFGRGSGSCQEAYLQSGLTEQQITFDDFRHSYSDTLCATDDGDLQATREGRVAAETR